MGNDRRELVRATYEQHAAHARHLERQRLSFTIVYLILMVAAVILWGIRPFWSSGWPIMSMLAVISLFGFIFCLEIQRTLKAYFASEALVLTRYSLDHYLPGGPKHMRLESAGLSILFPLLYLVGLVLSLFTLFRLLICGLWLSIVLAVIIAIIGIIVIWRYNRPAVSPNRSD